MYMFIQMFIKLQSCFLPECPSFDIAHWCGMNIAIARGYWILKEQSSYVEFCILCKNMFQYENVSHVSSVAQGPLGL